MDWKLATAISVLATSATILIQRSYSLESKAPSTYPTAASYLFGVLPIGLISGFFIFPHKISWSWWLVFLVLLQGIVMAISLWTGFKASSKMSVAPMQTINRISQIVVVTLGWTLLSEKLNSTQMIGSGILLVAAILAAWAPQESKNKLVFHKGPVFLGVISAVALGIGLVAEKAMLNHVEIGGIFLIAWSGQTISMLILAAKDFSKKDISNFYKNELRISTRMGLANGFSGVFYVYAISHSDNISLIQSLAAVSLPFTVLGAYIFLKEKENNKILWISVAMSCAGLYLLAV